MMGISLHSCVSLSHAPRGRRQHIPPHVSQARHTFVAMSPTLTNADFDWVGFDLDHAVARYHIWPLMRLVHDCLAAALIGFGVDADVFVNSYEPTHIHKGIVYDFETGDALLLAADGSVSAARHGGVRLSPQAVVERYGTSAWRGFDVLKRQARHETWFVLLTYFDMPSLCVLDAMVRAADAARAARDGVGASDGSSLPAGRAILLDDAAVAATAAPAATYAALRTLVVRAFDVIFDNVISFETGRGGFFSSIFANPDTYIARRPLLRTQLRRLRGLGGGGNASDAPVDGGILCGGRRRGRRTFLATNSQQRFAEALLVHALGEDWRECFDLVVYNALKPAWFAKLQPWHHAARAGGGGHEGPRAERITTTRPPVDVNFNATVSSTSDTCTCGVYVMGNAAGVQALADAQAAVEARPRLDGVTAPVSVHVDGTGKVTHAVVAATAQVADAAAAACSCSCACATPPAAASSSVVAFRVAEWGQTKGAVTREAAAWLAHGQSAPPTPLSHSTNTAAPAAAPAAPTIDGGAAAVDDGEDEPSVALSLRDGLAERVDPVSGAALPAGGRAAAVVDVEVDVGAGETEAALPPHARFLYIGDHIHGDVVAPPVECGWSSLCILEELETSSPGATEPLMTTFDGAAAATRGLSKLNWEGAAPSAWGSWFAAPGHAVGETAGGRSHLYFPQLVARHCVAAATDVEVALGALFGWS